MIKKISIILLFFVSVALNAQNSLSVSSTESAVNNEVEISISLSNSANIVAFQLKIPLNAQLKYVVNSCLLNSLRSDGHSLTALSINDTLKILSFSFSQKSYIGNEGEILRFKLNTGNQPGNYALNPVQCLISDVNSNALALETNSGNVKILAPRLIATPTSINFGRMPIRTEHTQYLNLQNTGNLALTIKNITSSNADITSSISFPQTIAVGSSLAVPVVLKTQINGPLVTGITIQSNSSILPTQTVAIEANPFSVNELYLSNVLGTCDEEVTVSLRMKNMENIAGWQTEIPINSLVMEYVSGSFTLSSRKTNHTTSTSFVNGKLTLMGFSLNNDLFTGNDGEIATFKLKLKGQYGQYWLMPAAVILANNAGVNMVSDVYNGLIEIKSPNLYTNSNTLNFDSSPVNEEKVSTLNIYNNGNAKLVINELISINPDFFNRITLPLTIEPWQSYPLNIYCKATKTGNNSSILKINSNSPTNRLVDINLNAHRFEPNYLEISNLTAFKNTPTELTVQLFNYSDISAVQFDLQYPNSSFALFSNQVYLTNRSLNHSIVAMPLNENTIRFLVFSIQNKFIIGNSGDLIQIPLNTTVSSLVGEHTFNIFNIVLSGIDGINKKSVDNVSKIIYLGDVNSSVDTEEITAIIYPNPVNDEILIKNSNFEFKKCSIFTFEGKLLLENELEGVDSSINVSLLKSGIYFIVLTGNDKIINYKIIKK